jgi:polysaccharide export outer membrane protein
VPELSKVVQVSENGTLNLPLVGEISVAGYTARDVENKLATLLGEKYLQKPQVTVFVKEYNSQRVTV